MEWLTISFDRPEYLLLLLAAPLIWRIGRDSLKSLSGWRRYSALGLRLLVFTCLVLALAELQIVRITQRIAAFFLLDQSLSVAPEQREAQLAYVKAAVAKHQDAALGDVAGVVVFGRDAHIEQPLSERADTPTAVESTVIGADTHLAAALRLAGAALPEGLARRVVIVSDGNETRGDAHSEARRLSDFGVGIDVAPLPHWGRSELLIEAVRTPSAIRSGAPFEVSLVVHNRQPDPLAARNVRGRLTVTRKAAGESQVIGERTVDLPPGKSLFSFRQELNDPGFYAFEARFTPDDPTTDRFLENNTAISHTHLRGRSRLLFIVNSEAPDDFNHLIARLRANEIEVVVQATDNLFSSLGELQEFDGVVLANTPRTSGDSEASLAQFSDEQIRMLTRNLEQFGAGVVMLGGPDSFGAGGWANTELERAMPVDFQIRNAKVAAVGALMLVIDRSGSMDGQKLAMSKAAAKAAVEMLGPHDHVGVVTFDSFADEPVRLQSVGERRDRILGMISKISSGGGTNLQPGLERGYSALKKVPASVKHMIVLTDGQTEGSGYAQFAAKMRRENITTTAVAVGPDAARTLLQEIAVKGGGKYYQVVNPKALPRIFVRETRRVVRPLVFEDAQGLTPQIVQTHEALLEMPPALPPITGYVLTTPKENSLVEVPVRVPKPGAPNNAVVATWQYGLGRAVVVTTDGGSRWANAWTEWENYDQFYVQLIRWSLRPLAEDDVFNVVTETKDGELQVLVTGVDSQGVHRNGLAMTGRAVAAGGAAPPLLLQFQQVGPGRYTASAPVAEGGSYLLAIQPEPGRAVLRSGVSVPYSREFSELRTNEPLLASLAALSPTGGKHGEVIRLPDDPRDWSRFQPPNPFRRDLPPGRSLTAVWPLVVLASAVLFFLDIFNRRVQWSLSEPIARLLAVVRGRPAAASAVKDERLSRLKQRKEQARAGQMAGARFVAQATAPSPTDAAALGELIPPESAALVPPAADAGITETEAPQKEDYAQRLLRIKRDLRTGRSS